MSLKEAHQRYEEIMNMEYLSPLKRDAALAELMSVMERDYGIPALHDPNWEAEHRSVIALYRIIAGSRSTI